MRTRALIFLDKSYNWLQLICSFPIDYYCNYDIFWSPERQLLVSACLREERANCLPLKWQGKDMASRWCTLIWGPFAAPEWGLRELYQFFYQCLLSPLSSAVILSDISIYKDMKTNKQTNNNKKKNKNKNKNKTKILIDEPDWPRFCILEILNVLLLKSYKCNHFVVRKSVLL